MSSLTEEERKKIVEEEQIRAEARLHFSQVPAKPAPKKMSGKQKRNLIGLILGVVSLIFVLIYWYLAIPVLLLAALWFWKRITISKKYKLYATAGIIVVFAAINGSLAYANRAPSIQILEPADNQSFQAKDVILKGRVVPKGATIKVRGTNVTVASDGTFEQSIPLPHESNTISILAENGKKNTTISLTFNRTFTEEEKKEQARIAQQNAQEEEKRKAEEEANKPVQEYKSQIIKLNGVLQTSFSTIGPIFVSKPDFSTWTQSEITQVAGLSVIIEKSYEVARDMEVPAQYKQFHSVWLQALKKYADAMPLMRQGFDERSVSKFTRATQLISEGAKLLERSTAEFEKVGK
ncbi:MAG: hypothetical protein K8Q97_01975 [Candidatus Andersenbacteria bacterium]|nr:hypothetical protein [Candidatus Andersenbacteria bacterium]